MLHHADRTANRDARPRKTGLRDLKRSIRKTTLDDLMGRFRFSVTDLSDVRIARLLERKKALDDQVSEMLRAGFREARIQQLASLLGFSEQEQVKDPRIAFLIKSVFDTKRYLAGLQPSAKSQPRTVAQE